MFDLKNSAVKDLIFHGNFGLEKESLRITEDGHFAQTRDPFVGEKHIVRDFAENQTEINTGVCSTPEEAIEELENYTQYILHTLDQMEPKEYLWPNSNPPFIGKESDIPVAYYDGDKIDKRVYLEYLAARYGRYKLVYSGIHVNYSFADDLIEAGFRASGLMNIREYKDRIYLKLAENLAEYGWIVTAITAASADMDGSFFERGKKNITTFFGMASVRCSEFGFWNQFTPVFDYSSLSSYVTSIRKYVNRGYIAFPSELYYPIRLKPQGENNLESLVKNGVNHIELRNVDINPLVYAGLDVRDLKFIQLLLIWLVSMPRLMLSEADQIQIISNFKNAARYDLGVANIVTPNGEFMSVQKSGIKVIDEMKEFYQTNFYEVPEFVDIIDILNFEQEKFIDPTKRYAWRLHKDFSDNFFEKNLELAKKKQLI